MRRLPWSAALRPLGGLAVLGAFALTVSCVPPYFPEINAAARLIRHMTPAGIVGPVSVQFGGAGGAAGSATVRFFPAKPVATSLDKVFIDSGFVVASTPTEDYLTFAYLNTSGNAQQVSAIFSSLPVSGADPSFPLYEYEVIASPAAQPSMIVFRYDPLSPTTASTYQEVQGNPATGQLTEPYAGGPLSGTIFVGGTPVGGSIDPAAPAPQDTFTFVVSAGASTNVASAMVNNPTGIFPAPQVMAATSNPFPAGLLRALVFSNIQAGSLVGQYRSGTAWVTDQWVGAATTVMTGVTKRLDAVLSDGDLVSTEGGNLTLYDSTGTGTQVLSTPLNGLQFCYEAWVGSTPYVFFTLPVADRHGDMIFNVFAIPTSQMRTLGQ